MRPLLLDTNAAIWIMRNEPLAPRAEEAMNAAHPDAVAVLVSPITAWESGLLVARNRLRLLMTPSRWFARLLALPGARLADLSTDILIDASFLPGKPPRDPVDRIMLATARDLGATLITRDRALLRYGEVGMSGARNADVARSDVMARGCNNSSVAGIQLGFATC